MTRFLSEALEAPEPLFRLGLRRLEAANGHPNTDIRFSTELMHSTRAKFHELGLDGRDTTPEELYHALQSRVQADDKRLTRKLQTLAATHISAEADVNAGMMLALKDLVRGHQTYALKNSVLKSLLKKTPPKRALKQLGYRSFDSLLKHESATHILAAAWLVESGTWRQKFLSQYKQLTPRDFEMRSLSVEQPRSQHWLKLSQQAVIDAKHTILSFKELGAVIVFAIPEQAPSGSVTATLALALHAVNDVIASGTYLKLCQVRPGFGSLVQSTALTDPLLTATALDQAVPWHIVQKFYARMQHAFSADLFEPHIELKDLSWHTVEARLSSIEPSFAFWESTDHLGVLHDRRIVSMNLVDAALNYCNNLPFERRLRHEFQKSLWHELLLRYLQPETVEQSVLAQLQPAFATEMITA